MLKGVLIDLSGVLYSGSRALPGATDAVRRLRSEGLAVRFLTNSTRRPKRTLVDRLRAFGVDLAPDELFTPAAAACDWLARHGHAPHLLIHPDLGEDFADTDTTGPEAVVLGDAGRFFTYEALNTAFRKIEAGAPLLALAANRVFRDADGKLSLDAGAFVAALEHASGKTALLFGKPAPGFFAAAAASMGAGMAEVAMIGDDAEADIAGALDAGAALAVLVRTGKYREGDETRFAPNPSMVADGIGDAVDALLV
ncbi:TIGR01458 family HAD-type hydrolase [Defluviimonas sp. WL0024]|uniref:Haloacid dehalogenase-like hydrolase domain-containing protein 2 n=1 Tax=Albidovulum salinarum TaxID=2984153 RepID=A0ABT2X787_9RHOB|nr:TIGR01458 family HAD-type hydrolase [Defluviimonas sp. WL0024]MCU9849604.1 TIGR01458 family HAD-type hydrolase [Defluviimonas sp. WL0024]